MPKRPTLLASNQFPELPKRKGFMTAGKVAYEAYFEFSGGKSLVSGAPLPKWDEQAESIREAWEFAARAVTQHCAQG